MNLTRCQDQKPVTLEEFYSKVSQDENRGLREGGEAMLNLLVRLRALPNNFDVYGLTSHNRLCLLAEDTYVSQRFVIIAALDRRNYFVEYLMPERDAPWPGARIHGEAISENEAVRMIEIAIANSEGWSE